MGVFAGLDVAPSMIELARTLQTTFEDQMRSSGRAVGVSEFVVHDAVAPLPARYVGSFDVVVAGYLLCNAGTTDELRGMAIIISNALRMGGRFVTLTANPDDHPPHPDTTARFGFVKLNPERQGRYVQ